MLIDRVREDNGLFKRRRRGYQQVRRHPGQVRRRRRCLPKATKQPTLEVLAHPQFLAAREDIVDSPTGFQVGRCGSKRSLG